MRLLLTILVASGALCTLVTGARAQGTDFLYWKEVTADSDPIFTSLVDLGMTGGISRSVDQFLDDVDMRAWPVVIIWRYRALSPGDEALVIDALQRHLDRGGRLMVNIAELDEMPAMQRFLGLEGAVDLELPLQLVSVVLYDRRFHPAAAGAPLPPLSMPTGPDFGDVLLPGPSAKSILEFRDDLTVASVLAGEGQVIVNGWEWSQWGTVSGALVATEQIRWLTSCPADLDGSGSLDIFDFLEFQSLFDAGDPKADWFDYDGELTVFDFLAYFNAFETGCS